MKEFNSDFTNIFNGLTNEEVTKKIDLSLLQCHNLQPEEGDYKLHDFVVDLDTDDYAWGNT